MAVSMVSDPDTDGISIISEDEGFLTWQQAAHENYQKIIHLLEAEENSATRADVTSLISNNDELDEILQDDEQPSLLQVPPVINK